MKTLKRIVVFIILIIIWPIGLIFLVKSKIEKKRKIIIGGITFLLFLIFWGVQFFVKYIDLKAEARQYTIMQNKYIDDIINETKKEVKDYNTKEIYSSNKVVNYLVNAYSCTLNGENRIGDAVQAKIDGKISQKDLVKTINDEDNTLTTLSDSAEALWHSGYLNRGDAYKSSIISDSISLLVDMNKNFIIEGINSSTIKDFDIKTSQQSKLMKEVLYNN